MFWLEEGLSHSPYYEGGFDDFQMIITIGVRDPFAHKAQLSIPAFPELTPVFFLSGLGWRDGRGYE